jgi:mitogen-activated protein kinase kinase kinase
MLEGKPPYSEIKNAMAVMVKIAKATQPPEIPTYLSDEGKDFLLKCL